MELLHKELSFKLNGFAIETRKEVGRFGKERTADSICRTGE